MGSAKAAGDAAGNTMAGIVGNVSLKHVYEIAKIKCLDERLGALGMERLCRSIAAQAASCGIVVVP